MRLNGQALEKFIRCFRNLLAFVMIRDLQPADQRYVQCVWCYRREIVPPSALLAKVRPCQAHSNVQSVYIVLTALF